MMRRRFSARQRMILRMRSGGHCTDCGEPLSAVFHADHRTPHSRGGPTTLMNGAALCPPCNLSKGNKKNIRLRPWQREALAKALFWYGQQADRHFVINAAPGAGKTLAAIAIATTMLESGLIDRVVVVAPRNAVVDQWAKEYEAKTGRSMARITGKSSALGALSDDLCATWAAVRGLSDAFQDICRSSRVLVICDEHHHAAIEAAWGRSADSAFADAKYALILTGTPVRSDGAASIWLSQDSHGAISHPEEGSYTLTYGEAVDLGFCRPVTFHRHEAKFKVETKDGELFSVSGHSPADVSIDHPAIGHLQRSLDFYRLAKTPLFEADGKTPLRTSYHATMIEEASSKLDDLREEMPSAGGLVIAPTIDVAEHFAKLIEIIEREPAAIVHSEVGSPDARIAMFRDRSNIRWIVSVGMVAEGVDIKRLRVLVYLPHGTTELMFRQAVGRVVRSSGDDDCTRAYVVMPSFQTFEDYARRIEADMPASTVETHGKERIRRCAVCEGENAIGAVKCSHCDAAFPERPPRFRTCRDCEGLNPSGVDACQNCGHRFDGEYVLTLDQALRNGVISRGIDIEEADVLMAEAEAPLFKARRQQIGDDRVARFISQIPKELIPAFRDFFKAADE